MKFTIKNLALFLFLAAAFSALINCGGGVKSGGGNNGNGGSNSGSGNTANNSNATKSANYPMLPAPVLQAEFKKLDGGTMKLTDYNGKVVLVNLWATWCGPCKGEMPHLIDLQNAHKDKGFEILGLDTDTDESEQVVKDFAADMKLNYTLGWIERKDYDELLKISKFPGIPQSFLVSRDGRLLGVFTGGSPTTIAKLREFVEKAVNEN